MIAIHVHVPETHRARVAYVLDLLLDILGLEHRFVKGQEEPPSRSDLLLHYGDLREGCPPQTARGRLCIQAALGEEVPDEIRHLRWGELRIPVLFWEDVELSGVPLIHFDDPPRPAAVFQEESGQILMSADPVWTCFYLISRWEEHDPARRDELGRFSPQSSLAFRHGFLRFPVVDATVALLDSLLAHIHRACRIPSVRVARWPGGRRWALCLSHDVDWVKKWTPGGIVKYLVQKKLPRWTKDGHWRQRLAIVLQDLRSGRDPYDNIDDILELESQHRAVSTFFFLPGVPDQRRAGRKILGRYPRRFDLGRLARHIRQAGGEVELHGSFNSYDDERQLARERELLHEGTGCQPRGVRQHFLRYRFPMTVRCHEAVGLTYDSTLGFGDLAGYRCGISFPYRLFDLPEDRRLMIMEIPLVIMDGALDVIRGGTVEASWATVDELFGRAEQFGGVCTLLWHNTSFAEGDDGGLLKGIYVRSLRRAASSQAWLCSCGQLLTWWQWRTGIKLDAVDHRPDGEYCWHLRLPPGGQPPLVLEFLTHGRFRPAIAGGQGHMLSADEGGDGGWVRFEVSQWDQQDLRIRLIPQ
jgi:hypothetical protein